MQQKEPKKINFAEKVFTANGRKYFISPSVSIGRAVYMEEAQIEQETGVRVGRTTDQFVKIWNHLQKGEIANASVECYNSMKAVETFFDRPLPVLRMCACFMNREDEDITKIDDDLVRSKIEDWIAEGIAMESFFTIALIFIAEDAADLKNFTAELKKVGEQLRQKLAQNELNTPISESLL